MSKSLKIIQSVMKVFQVLLKIAFVFCIIGALGCIAATTILVTPSFLNREIGGKPIPDFILDNAGVSVQVAAAYCGAAIVLCIAGAVQCMFKLGYFNKELEEGTPFTYNGSETLKDAAIKVLVTDLISVFISVCVFAFMTYGIVGVSFDGGAISIVDPLLMLFGSVIFRYGSEVRAPNK